MTTRRDFLKGSASFLSALTLGVPQLVRAQDGSAKKLILVTCHGGWDVSFHLDPKPAGLSTVDTPEGSMVTRGDLSYFNATSTAGVVDDFFQQHGDVSSIVRGISVRSISHDVCIRRMLTGSPLPEAPDMGVIAGATHGASLPSPYLTLGAISFPGDLEGHSVRQGTSNQLSLAHNYDQVAPDIGANFPNVDEQALINAYLKNSGQDFKALRGQYGLNAKKAQDYLDSLERVQGLYENRGALGSAFSLNLGLQEQIDAALQMLERGVAWAVNTSTGFVWDTHDPAAAVTGTYQGAQGTQNQILWPAVSALLSELKTRPGSSPGSKMIDETVVVVLSEMTRTPLYNEAGGKDHWPYTSALVAGGGVAGGKTFSATDDTLTAKPIDPSTGLEDAAGFVLETDKFVAGILDLVGVDPAVHLPQVPVFSAIKASA